MYNIFKKNIKDNTIYSSSFSKKTTKVGPDINKGNDEVLELSKMKIPPISGSIYLTDDDDLFLVDNDDNFLTFDGTIEYASSRILFSIDQSELVAWVTGKTLNNTSFYLSMKNVTTDGSVYNFPVTLQVSPLTESWVEGYGKSDEANKRNGSTWIHRDIEDDIEWGIVGGTYDPSKTIEYTVDKNQIFDLYINITPIVKDWINNVYVNNGLLINIKSDTEDDDIRDINPIMLYSSETNTIYEPKVIGFYDTSTVVNPHEDTIIFNFNDEVSLTNTNVPSVLTTDSMITMLLLLKPRSVIKEFYYNVLSPTKYAFNNDCTLTYEIVDSNSDDIIVPQDVRNTLQYNGTYYTCMLTTKGLYEQRRYTVNVYLNKNNEQRKISTFTFRYE